MSEGPIKKWRESHQPPVVSTTDVDRVCLVRVIDQRASCGRKLRPGHHTTYRDEMSCADCSAALRADQKGHP